MVSAAGRPLNLLGLPKTNSSRGVSNPIRAGIMPRSFAPYHRLGDARRDDPPPPSPVPSNWWSKAVAADDTLTGRLGDQPAQPACK
jgi:hypothetical protein